MAELDVAIRCGLCRIYFTAKTENDDNHALIRSGKPIGRFSSLKIDETYFYHFFYLIYFAWPAECSEHRPNEITVRDCL